jgi:hypothetical protein
MAWQMGSRFCDVAAFRAWFRWMPDGFCVIVSAGGRRGGRRVGFGVGLMILQKFEGGNDGQGKV